MRFAIQQACHYILSTETWGSYTKLTDSGSKQSNPEQQMLASTKHVDSCFAQGKLLYKYAFNLF